MNRTLARLAAGLGFTLLSLGSASGDLVITIGNATVIAGSSSPTLIPVLISDTSTSGDLLDNYSARFVIQPSAANPTPPVASLQFVYPADASQDPTLRDPGYVFYQGGSSSFDEDTGTPVGSLPAPSTTFTTSDFEGFAGTDPLITSNDHFVLADLLVTFAPSATTNLGGDVFTIGLDTANSSFINSDSTPIAFSAELGGGTILVSASATPEPPSVVNAASAAILFGICRWVVLLSRRRSRARTLQAAGV